MRIKPNIAHRVATGPLREDIWISKKNFYFIDYDRQLQNFITPFDTLKTATHNRVGERKRLGPHTNKVG